MAVQPQDKQINPVLSNFAMGIIVQHYVATKILSILPVGSKSGKFFKFLRGILYRDDADVRAPGTRSKGGSHNYATDNYYCEEIAWHEDVPDEARDNEGMPLKPEQDAVAVCMAKIMLSLERITAGILLNPTNWAAGHTEDAEGGWKAGASSTFYADVIDKMRFIQARGGMKPNKLVIDDQTYTNAKQDEIIMDKIKYTQRGVLTKDLLADIFELDQVIVGDAIFSTSEETKDDEIGTTQAIWETNPGKGSGLLLYAPEVVGVKEVTAAVIFRWVRSAMRTMLAQAPTNMMPVGIRQWRVEDPHSDRFEGFMDTDVKISGPDLGFLFTDTNKR
jgi:hypothetical protein